MDYCKDHPSLAQGEDQPRTRSLAVDGSSAIQVMPLSTETGRI